MSDSISQASTTGGGSQAFAMNASAQSQLEVGAEQFNGLLSSGASTGAINNSLQSLQQTVGQDLQGYYGDNQAGLNATSYKDLSGAQYQMGQLETQVGGGADSMAQLSQFGNMLQSALAPQAPPTAAPAQSADSATVGQSDGMQGILQQMVSLLQQMVSQMGQGSTSQGSTSLGSTGQAGGPSSTSPSNASPAADGSAPAATGAPAGGQDSLQSIISELISLLQQVIQQVEGGAGNGSSGAAAPGGQTADPSAAGSAASPSSGPGGPSDPSGQMAALIQQLTQMLGGAQGGSSSGAPAAAAPASSSPSDPVPTGNLSQDLQTLQQMVSANGTNGTQLANFAGGVTQEADSQGNNSVAATTGNIANSLSDGSYSQQASETALNNLGQGQSASPSESGQADLQQIVGELLQVMMQMMQMMQSQSGGMSAA